MKKNVNHIRLKFKHTLNLKHIRLELKKKKCQLLFNIVLLPEVLTSRLWTTDVFFFFFSHFQANPNTLRNLTKKLKFWRFQVLVREVSFLFFFLMNFHLVTIKLALRYLTRGKDTLKKNDMANCRSFQALQPTIFKPWKHQIKTWVAILIFPRTEKNYA